MKIGSSQAVTTVFLLPLLMASVWADNLITPAPAGHFEIVQHYDDKIGWSETLCFHDDHKKDVVLENEIPWPGNYYISSNDRWILRVQKTGSGDNTAYLYFWEKNGAIWRLEKQLPEMGFSFLEKQHGPLPSGMYHDGIEFISWDIPHGLLHFSIHASSDPGTKGVRATLTYRLNENRISEP